MKSDKEIEQERTVIMGVLGPVQAEWYAEACRIEIGDDHRVMLWACRCRELCRTTARDLGTLANAARELVAACGRLDEGGGQRVKDAVEAVEIALWWEA